MSDAPDWEAMTETDTATRAQLSAEHLVDKQEEMDASFRDLVSVIQSELKRLRGLK